ncbi:SIMPL domain-containing protein [Rhodanobacter sp. AS-Z3]|uniref:SIMPL domain-containing protein n=1 Tax=Rhodanobacter sp. AS-Z3 TaxID=3031330 RepID=UPI002478E0F3|nr:SIMPL domain-containing protein [Rhodanobacter sp. AS-Z3]WEN16017.1 SIMPL domain-containing protein [Rhodanobacter sp. AS-Z3]
MKRLLVALALLLGPSAVLAQVNALPAAPHLLVKGHAQGRYVPDRFTIHLTVNVVNKAPAIARTKVEAHVKQILEALKKHGALDDRTQASSLSVRPKTEERNDTEVFVGTEVSRTVDATFDNSDKLRDLLGELVTSDELTITGVDVKRSDEVLLRNELRKRAMADSQQSAQQIAKAYGMRLKSVYSVSEVPPSSSYGMTGDLYAVTVSGTALPEVALRVGTIELEQDIYAVYLTTP